MNEEILNNYCEWLINVKKISKQAAGSYKSWVKSFFDNPTSKNLDKNKSSALKKFSEFLDYSRNCKVEDKQNKKLFIPPQSYTPFNPTKGKDVNQYGLVRYEESILEDDRIEGLCKYLDTKYHKIYEYAKGLFNDFKQINGEPLDSCLISVIIKKGNPTKDYSLKLDCKTCCYKEKCEKSDLLKVLCKKEIKYVLGIEGEFIPTDCIYLYYENISATNMDDYFKNLEMVLAHEFMHSIQYKFFLMWPNSIENEIKNNGLNKIDFDVKNILFEAPAECFANMYISWSIDNINNKYYKLAEDRFEFWRNYIKLKLSYAYAKCFVYDNGVLDSWPKQTNIQIQSKFIEVCNSLIAHRFVDAFVELICHNKDEEKDLKYKIVLIEIN